MKNSFLIFGISLLGIFVAAIFIYPNPNENYSGFWWGWLTGSFHGALLIPNWIISLFDESRLIKANTYSSWYNFNWWLWAIGNILNLLKVFVPLFRKVRF
jgi:hypothetical protein